MNKMILTMVFCGLVLGGCGKDNPLPKTGVMENQSVTVTKVGTITMKSGDEWLMTNDEGIVNLASSRVDLDDYLKKRVKVTGVYSGTTLYVDKIEIN